MNTDDLDRQVLKASGAFILGSTLAGVVAGLALCLAVLLLALAPTPVTIAFSLAAVIGTLGLSAWIASRGDA